MTKLKINKLDIIKGALRLLAIVAVVFSAKYFFGPHPSWIVVAILGIAFLAFVAVILESRFDQVKE